MHRHINAGRADLHRQQRLGDILRRVGAAHFVGAHCSGEHDGFLGAALGLESFVDAFTGLGKPVGAMHDHNAIVIARHDFGGVGDEVVIGLSHVERVLVEQRHAINGHAAQLKRGQQKVEHADLVGEHASEFVVGLLDGAASGNEGDAIGSVGSAGCHA